MTAANRITAAQITVGTHINVERGPGGRLLSTRVQRGSITVTVTGKDTVTVEGGRQRRYVIHTTEGQTLPVPGAQTIPVQVVHDPWGATDRVLRYVGDCFTKTCGRPVWAFDDGENSPLGVLGDSSADTVDPREHGEFFGELTGPSVAQCSNHANEYETRTAAEDYARTLWTRGEPERLLSDDDQPDSGVFVDGVQVASVTHIDLTAPAAEVPAEVPAGADQDDAQPGDDQAAEPIYTAPVDWYTPTLTSDADAELTITHDHENGTVMDSGTKGDGTLEIVGAYHFQWRRFAGVHIPGSRDHFADLASIDKAAEALRAAGHTVAVEIDDVWRPAGTREGHRAERVTARVERLAARATARFAESDARHLAARNIADGMPFGEPVKVGHHSEGRHRRAFERIDNNTRAAVAADDYARHLAARAGGAENNEAAKHGARAIMRRVERLEAEARSWARELADEKTGDGRRRRATLEGEKIAEDIRHQLAKLGDMAASGAFVAWAGEHFQRGDWANVAGRWCEVARVNRKGVSVFARFDWMTRQDRPQPVRWDEIHGRRRDGMQWDAPNGAPYSVQDAQRAAKWRRLVRDAARSVSGEPTDEIMRRINVQHAERITLGLALDAADAEVTAYGTPDTQEGKRARALACFAVYERLNGGEKAPDVAATVQPIGDTVPAWTMPAGDTIDVYPRDLVAGDVIAGVYDHMWGGGDTLLRSFVGPLAGPPVHEDRRESGDWYTVRLTTGDEKSMKSHRRLAVHRVTTLAAEPVPDVDRDDPAPTYGLDVDGVPVAVVTRVDLTAPAAEMPAEVPAPAVEAAAPVDGFAAAVADLEGAGYAVRALDLSRAPDGGRRDNTPAIVRPGNRVDVGWSGGMVDVTSIDGDCLVGTFGDEPARIPLEQVRAVVPAGMTADPVHVVRVVNDGHGNLDVHRVGCRDIWIWEKGEGAGDSWDVSTQDLRGIVAGTYNDHEGFAADGSNWRDFAGNVTVMPCVANLPDEAAPPRTLADVTAAPATVQRLPFGWTDLAAVIAGDVHATVTR